MPLKIQTVKKAMQWKISRLLTIPVLCHSLSQGVLLLTVSYVSFLTYSMYIKVC